MSCNNIYSLCTVSLDSKVQVCKQQAFTVFKFHSGHVLSLTPAKSGKCIAIFFWFQNMMYFQWHCASETHPFFFFNDFPLNVIDLLKKLSAK